MGVRNFKGVFMVVEFRGIHFDRFAAAVRRWCKLHSRRFPVVCHSDGDPSLAWF